VHGVLRSLPANQDLEDGLPLVGVEADAEVELGPRFGGPRRAGSRRRCSGILSWSCARWSYHGTSCFTMRTIVSL
jgi:hypothetical protein